MVGLEVWVFTARRTAILSRMVRLSVGIFKAEGKADDTTETTFKTIQNSSLPLPKASACHPTGPLNEASQVKLKLL